MNKATCGRIVEAEINCEKAVNPAKPGGATATSIEF
jgi:hypothetical protein